MEKPRPFFSGFLFRIEDLLNLEKQRCWTERFGKEVIGTSHQSPLAITLLGKGS